MSSLGYTFHGLSFESDEIEGSKVLSCAVVSDLVNSMSDKSYKINLLIENKNLKVKGMRNKEIMSLNFQIIHILINN